MTENGRGAWPNRGYGGTKEIGRNNTVRPGPYYLYAQGDRKVGGFGADSEFINRRAVHYAVKAIQRAVNREAIGMDNIEVDGVFGIGTEEGVRRWQESYTEQHPDSDLTVWGGIGQASAKALFLPLLNDVVSAKYRNIVCGYVLNEAGWDPGAVGYIDPGDLGLAQISAIVRKDKGITEEDCFKPITAFKYIEQRFTEALETFDGVIRDAIVSYNLGDGGTRSWIRDGRPDMWDPSGFNDPSNMRCVKCYADRIEQGCKEA